MTDGPMRQDEGPEAFMRSLEWGKKGGLTFVGPTLFYPIRDDRFAKITLDSLAHYGCATQGTFTGVKVEIIDSEKGRIDQHDVMFDDVLTKDDRKTPKDQTNCFDRGFQVIASCGWRWYLAEPKSTRRFCKIVEEYIGRFR